MTSIIDNESDSQAQRIERMKNEFLRAQLRRRQGPPATTPRPDDAGDGPVLAGPVHSETAVAAERSVQ